MLPIVTPSIEVIARLTHFLNTTGDMERELDGRWIAELPEPPGVLVRGTDQNDALARLKSLARRVIADPLEHGEAQSGSILGEAGSPGDQDSSHPGVWRGVKLVSKPGGALWRPRGR